MRNKFSGCCDGRDSRKNDISFLRQRIEGNAENRDIFIFCPLRGPGCKKTSNGLLKAGLKHDDPAVPRMPGSFGFYRVLCVLLAAGACAVIPGPGFELCIEICAGIAAPATVMMIEGSAGFMAGVPGPARIRIIQGDGGRKCTAIPDENQPVSPPAEIAAVRGDETATVTFMYHDSGKIPGLQKTHRQLVFRQTVLEKYIARTADGTVLFASSDCLFNDILFSASSVLPVACEGESAGDSGAMLLFGLINSVTCVVLPPVTLSGIAECCRKNDIIGDGSGRFQSEFFKTVKNVFPMQTYDCCMDYLASLLFQVNMFARVIFNDRDVTACSSIFESDGKILWHRTGRVGRVDGGQKFHCYLQ